MSKAMRVVVPPHPLIAHWLTVLRDRQTPAPLVSTALEELGHWLCYEAVRDWLPYRRITVETPAGTAQGQVVDPGVPLLAIQVVQGGQELWSGARRVLPQSRLLHVMAGASDYRAGELFPNLQGFLGRQLPRRFDSRQGVLLLLPQISTGIFVHAVLTHLAEAGASGRRVRVLTALASQPGLQILAEAWPELTVYTACIDADLDEEGHLLPGMGDPLQRLYGLDVA